MSLAAIILAALAPAAAGTRITVDANGQVRSVAAAVALAQPGDEIIVHAGTYREPAIVVRTPRISIRGVGWPVLDGDGAHSIIIVEADSVTISGIVVRNSGTANIEDRAGIRVRGATGCFILDNRLADNMFGVYLERSSHCVVSNNQITAREESQAIGGNGIHLWYSPDATIERNRVRGHRDGIYFEFSERGVTRENISERNQRYGLHFMYSDSCRYEANVFRANHSGVAVMYSRGVTIRGNTFTLARGAAAYGLLLKEILGGVVDSNRFADNSTALLVEGSNRLMITANRFLRNGWGVRIMADARENSFTANVFAGNAFDVGTNAGTTNSTFDRNWWDAYRGYDLDRDGVGDVPFRPVRLFALVVEQHPEALALLRSPLVSVMDIAERVMPVLTPAVLADANPLMKVPR